MDSATVSVWRDNEGMVLKLLSPWPVPAAIALLACLHMAGTGGVSHDDRAFMVQAVPEDQPNLAPPASLQAGRTVELDKAPDGLFYVSARVNGAPVRFLVDTGANLVVLTAQDAQRAGLVLKTSRSAGNIDTAAGSAAMERVRLQSVNVGGQEASGIDAAVMHGLKVSLLGQNMLSKLGDVTISGDEMALHPRKP